MTKWLLLFFVFIASPSWAAEYHVTTTGSDAADCSSGTPCATLEHVCDLVVPGDVVKVHGDGNPLTIDYSQGAICSIDGTADSRITIEGYDPNDRPMFSYAPAYTGGWTNVGTNLWRTTIAVTVGGQEVYGFYKYDPTTGTTTILNKEFSTGAVDAEGDWFTYKGVTFPNKFLLYTTSDPNSYAGEFRFIDTTTNSYSNGILLSASYYTVKDINYKFSWNAFSTGSGRNHIIIQDVHADYCINRAININTSPSSPSQDILIENTITSNGRPSYIGYAQAPDQHGIKLASGSNTMSGSNVRIVNAESYNNNYHGLQISEAWQGVEVYGGKFHNNNLGSHSDGANIRIGTTEKSTHFRVHGVESYGTQFGINLFANINDVIISGNYFHDNTTANAYFDNASLSWGNCEDQNCYFHNNILENGSGAGIQLDDTQNWKIYNNTIIGSTGAGIDVLDNFYSSNSGELKNNIVISPTGSNIISVASGEAITADYNAFYSPDATPFSYGGVSYNFSDHKTASSQDTNSINTDFTSDFINYAGGNYAIKPTATIKDAGTTLPFAYDYRLLTRPQGAGFSIGAYEEGEVLSARGITLNGVSLQ